MARPSSSLAAYTVFDFLRGLDTKTSALKLALLKGQNALTGALNAIYTASGAVSKRLDSTALTTSALGATVVITGGVEFVKSDGARYTVIGTNDGRLFTLSAAGAASQFASGFTSGTRWYFAQYNDRLICCNRADLPRSFTGGETSALMGGAPAKGGPVRVHGNRVFMFDGTAGAKSTLYWSALNNEQEWTGTGAGSAEISKNDGSDLVDMVPSINELVLLKGARPYRLQGTSPDTFTIANVVPTTGSVGAISTQGAAFAVNQVWYAARNGVVSLVGVQQFGDLRESFASDKIRTYWEPGSENLLSLNNLDDCVLAYDSQWNRLYQAVDTDNDGANDTVLVYDLTTKGWSVWEGLAIASLWPVLNATTGITEMWAGGYDGTVRVLNRDVAVNAIDCRITHLSCLDAPGVEKSLRHLFLYLKEEGNYSVNVTTRFDFGASGGQVYTASLLGGSHTLGVNWVLGTDPLGAQTQIVKRIDTHGTGEFLEVTVSNENAGEPFTWYGYEALSRPRRVVRRGTVMV